MKPTSRFSCRSCTKSIGKVVSRMTKSLAYIGVLVLVVGVLLTTCVGSAWSMTLLTDEQMAEVHGRSCAEWDCVSEMCGTAKPCSLTGGSPTDNCEKFDPMFDCSEKIRLPYKQCQTTGSDYECSNEDKVYDCVRWKCGIFSETCHDCSYNLGADTAWGCDS